MIFLDSNIPMYLVGADHPNKAAARIAAERLVADGVLMITDAEVHLEILHRYAALDRHVDIQPAFDVLDALVDDVLAIERADVEGAQGTGHGDADAVRAGRRPRRRHAPRGVHARAQLRPRLRRRGRASPGGPVTGPSRRHQAPPVSSIGASGATRRWVVQVGPASRQRERPGRGPSRP